MTEGVPCRIQIQENNHGLALDQRGRLASETRRKGSYARRVEKLKPTTHNCHGVEETSTNNSRVIVVGVHATTASALVQVSPPFLVSRI
jgi:hypothetical protein